MIFGELLTIFGQFWFPYSGRKAHVLHAKWPAIGFGTMQLLVDTRERKAKHNHIKNALHQVTRQAALGPRKKMQSIITGSSTRPVHVYTPNCFQGRHAALDVTVVSPLKSTLNQFTNQEDVYEKAGVYVIVHTQDQRSQC